MTDQTAGWLVQKIKVGDPSAWQDLIDLYEGRLSAFVSKRLSDRTSVDDVVQETFLGFLRSLPHFDATRDLENYLFTIAAHKIRDQLRRNGRHPLNLLGDIRESQAPRDPADSIRGPSSLLASRERMSGEEERLAATLTELIDEWRSSDDYRRIKCMELLFVAGWGNKEVGEETGLTEQQVANYKFQFIERLSRRHKPQPST